MLKINFNTLKITGPIVIGVSGGSDSMALLHYIIHNYKDKIIVVNINHNIRKESYIEEEYIKKISKQNNLIFECMKITNYTKNNFENEAREKRYRFYEEILKKYNSKFLFLAHHADDLIETIIMKMIRGSNILGYSGIKKMTKKDNYYIVRPFIDYTKEEILDYIKLNNITYFEDYTNKDTTYTRNRIRTNMLPLLKKEDKLVHKKFIKYSKTLNEYSDYTNYEIEKNMKEVYNKNKLELNKFKNLHPFLKKHILYHIINDIYNNKTNTIKEKNILNILSIIESNKPNAKINLKDNLVVIKEYNILTFKKDNTIDNYKIPFDNTFKIDNYIIKKINNCDTDGNDICKLDSSKISFPLYIRNKKEGDKIEVLGLNGTKKIKDIFIEKKLPTNIRKKYPLLVDSNDNILWIPNIKKSKFNSKNNEKYDIILKYYEKEEDYE